MSKYFITGIGTDVGKTVVSAIFTEALHADYWKPVQAGELDHTDTHKVQALLSNARSRMHDHSYALSTPMSPHAAAEIDNVFIDPDEIREPQTENHLVIEGAGGLLVPLNDTKTILDLIKNSYKIIVVSRHYLGSINHTLLTLSELKRKGLEIAGIVFVGKEHKSTEQIVRKIGQVKILGRVDEEPVIDKQMIRKYAAVFAPILKNLS
jgi:dethiobiotin synthetase